MQTANDFSTTTVNPLLGFITSPKYRWLRHTLFIAVGLVLAFNGDINVPVEFVNNPAARNATLLVDIGLFVVIIGVIYLLVLVAIPRLLFRSRLLLFSLSFFAMVFIIYFAVWLLDLYVLRPVLPANDSRHVYLSVGDFLEKSLVSAVLLGCVVGLMVFKKWITDMRRMNELQQINLKTELDQLKSQVNPHFLFNTLNNLHVLTKTDPEKASQVLLGLSDLLRYQLYDSAKEKIILSKDIAFINNLLSLEKIRKDDFDFEVEAEGSTDRIMLPPFLFIPFVENAIKHGASTIGHSYLKLRFQITDGQIFFYSENSKPPVRNNFPGGIGLKNIKRRLDLLYPGKYKLEITDTKNKYIVHLTLPL